MRNKQHVGVRSLCLRLALHLITHTIEVTTQVKFTMCVLFIMPHALVCLVTSCQVRTTILRSLAKSEL